jgi:two-component system, OmpR family, response regulator ResD
LTTNRTSPLQPASARILVADDDELVRSLMRTILGGSGYTVDEAADGEEALQKCQDSSFDLLLMDENMPKMSGPDACAAIRQRKPGMKVLMLSGGLPKTEETDTDIRFLAKPFDNRELVLLVRQMLRG